MISTQVRWRYCGLVNSSFHAPGPAMTTGLSPTLGSGSGSLVYCNTWRSYSAMARSASSWRPCASSHRGDSGSFQYSNGNSTTISMIALIHRNSRHWSGISQNASILTLTATSAVTPCEASNTLLRTSGEFISDRYTECVATMPPTPSVLSTDSTTMPQKLVT